MFNTLVSAAFLLGSALANYQCFDDGYDDLAGSIVPTANPIGVYHGLQYTAFGVSDHSMKTDALAPHSQPNGAITTVANDAQSGIMSPSPQGSIAITGKTKSFDLRSFYFSCDITSGQGAVSAPVGCTVSVNAYYVNGQQAPVATFAFAPDRLVYAPMVFAVLPGTFVGLQNATIGVAGSGGIVTDTALLIDDLYHCNTS